MKRALDTALLIVVSAPSGAGKSTLCDLLLDKVAGLTYSVSCTTRAPRGQEQDGVDYTFLSKADFEGRIVRGAFLEYAQVHGNYYGTLRETVMAALRRGESVLMDIDVQGAAQIRAAAAADAAPAGLASRFVDVFIAPPALEVLRQRLMARDEDTVEVIEQRLRNAGKEMASASLYQYIVVNDTLERAREELMRILFAEASRRAAAPIAGAGQGGTER